VPVLTAPGDIRSLLSGVRTIAVVGLSSDPSRDSCHVADYLAHSGYRIIGVNPYYRAGPTGAPAFRGEKVYPSLAAMPPGDLAAIDLVDVFRKPEEAAAVAREAARLRIPAIWFQLGVGTPEAIAEADRAGMVVVAESCIMTAHRILRPSRPMAVGDPGGD
jgi:uncharacterized protein